LKKGLSNIELFHPESFEQKYGIEVHQFLDLKALKGDSSDNIPGAPGIGEKTAAELLRQYKTLDGIYDNLALIKDSTRKKLEAGKDSVSLSKKLAAIWTDAPIKLDLKQVDGSKCQPQKVQEVLQKLEFRTLARQLPEYMHMPEDKAVKKSKQVTLPDASHINTDKELQSLTLPKTEELVIYGLSDKPHGENPLSLTFSPSASQSVTLNLSSLDALQVRSKLKDYIESAELVGHNLKATLQILMTLGIFPQKIKHDTLIGAFLINPLRREQSLSELAETELDVHLQGIDGANSEEIAVIRKLYEQQLEEFKGLKKMAKLAADIEWPIIPVLSDMEYRGIKLDVEYLKKVAEQLKDTISDIEQQIYGHADREFNIASPAQLSDVLFNKLMLPTDGIKKGKSAYSTAANELDKLRGRHPIIDLITQYREVTKLMSTYVVPLPSMVDAHNRLHTTFSLTTAQTGRLSSSDPNLQNIPVRTELGRQIRAAFIADPGKMLVSADYSQFELRMAAFLAKDQEFIDMFNRDVDVHTATASQIYEREAEDVTKNMRRDAKVVNFGILYGMSPHGLSVATGMTQGAAKKFIDKYFELRKPILEYMNKSRELARSQGYVETLFGRRRPTPDVKSSNFAVRAAAERAAINMPLQGTCADIMKLAMIKIQDKLAAKDGVDMLLQIHDSVLVECPQEQAEDVAHEIKEIMENAYKLDIKLTVDTAIGKNWGEL
jgi:DNA polymerase-1